MGTHYTGIIYGIDLSDGDSEDWAFWSDLHEEHSHIAKANKIQGKLTTARNADFPFIGYAIAYNDSYLAKQEKVGTYREKIIVTPSLKEYCELNFTKYCMIANDSWDKLITYLQKTYPDRKIPQREFFAIEDYD